MKRPLQAIILTGAIGLATALGTAPESSAVPGQCMGTPWGGFCDQAPQPDGRFYHCESVLGFSNCFWVRPVGTDIDPRGWVPA